MYMECNPPVNPMERVHQCNANRKMKQNANLSMTPMHVSYITALGLDEKEINAHKQFYMYMHMYIM